MGTVVKRSYSFQWGTGNSLSHHYMVLYAFSLRYFATKFDLLMFSNIFDIISTFTVELKVYFFVVLPVQQQQNGRLCYHEIFS